MSRMYDERRSRTRKSNKVCDFIDSRLIRRKVLSGFVVFVINERLSFLVSGKMVVVYIHLRGM